VWWVCDVCLCYVLVSVCRVCYAAAGVAGGVCSTSTGGAGVAARVTRIRVACAAPAASVSGVLLVGCGIGNSVMWYAVGGAGARIVSTSRVNTSTRPNTRATASSKAMDALSGRPPNSAAPTMSNNLAMCGEIRKRFCTRSPGAHAKCGGKALSFRL
jgi:hypothetical protein